MICLNADLDNNHYRCVSIEHFYQIKQYAPSNKIYEYWSFTTKSYVVYAHNKTSSIYKKGKIGNAYFLTEIDCLLELDTTDEDIDAYIAFQ